MTAVYEGFTDVRPVDDEVSFDGVTIHRTPGHHGHEDLAEAMGPVSGFVFEADETLYLAGDTVWYDPVERTLERIELVAPVVDGHTPDNDYCDNDLALRGELLVPDGVLVRSGADRGTNRSFVTPSNQRIRW